MTVFHEQILIESYALGYLAHKLDEYSPENPLDFEPLPLYDNLFIDLMRKNNILTPTGRVVVKGQKLNFKKYTECYTRGYNDSLTGNASRVYIPKKKEKIKAWTAAEVRHRRFA
jgi:hypothetical protein